jgi:hypothetical protein
MEEHGDATDLGQTDRKGIHAATEAGNDQETY